MGTKRKALDANLDDLQDRPTQKHCAEHAHPSRQDAQPRVDFQNNNMGTRPVLKRKASDAQLETSSSTPRKRARSSDHDSRKLKHTRAPDGALQATRDARSGESSAHGAHAQNPASTSKDEECRSPKPPKDDLEREDGSKLEGQIDWAALELRQANDFFKELVVFYEEIRTHIEDGVDIFTLDSVREQLKQICAHAVRPLMKTNSKFWAFPNNWFEVIKQLETLKDQVKELEIQISPLLQERVDAKHTLNEVVLQRIELQLEMTSGYERKSTMEDHEERVLTARGRLSAANRACVAMEKQTQSVRDQELSLTQKLISGGESALMHMSFLSWEKTLSDYFDRPPSLVEEERYPMSDDYAPMTHAHQHEERARPTNST